MVPAATVDTSTGWGAYPSFLASVRDAATDGVAWLAAAPPNTDTGPGTLVLNYARWETTTARTLDRSQVIAGPPVTASAGFVMSVVSWAAVKGDTGAQTALAVASTTAAGTFGYQGLSLRLYGDVTNPGGAELNAANQTATAVLNDRANPSETILDTVDVQSGWRTGPTGGPSSAEWDPYAHTFAPTDVVALVDNYGATKHYRVTKSDHRLVATVWQTTHTLEKFTAPAALP
jgi:hypothetical protein